MKRERLPTLAQRLQELQSRRAALLQPRPRLQHPHPLQPPMKRPRSLFMPCALGSGLLYLRGLQCRMRSNLTLGSPRALVTFSNALQLFQLFITKRTSAAMQRGRVSMTRTIVLSRASKRNKWVYWRLRIQAYPIITVTLPLRSSAQAYEFSCSLNILWPSHDL